MNKKEKEALKARQKADALAILQSGGSYYEAAESSKLTIDGVRELWKDACS